MSQERRSKAKEKLLMVFSDKFMVLWLVLAVGGLFTLRHSRTLGILLCAPAVVFFAAVFVMLFISNRNHKTKGQ